jgi:prepilin-type processing-associated H-X9-DG protein
MCIAAFSDYFVWWQLPLLAVFTVIWFFGGGTMLWVGGRFAAKCPEATFGRSLGVWILASLGGLLVCWIPFGPLFAMWLIIMWRFHTSFGKAILAWLPTLGAAVFYVPVLMTLLLPTLGRARELTKMTMCGTHVSVMGKALALYEADNNDVMPQSLDVLVTRGLLTREVFACPSDDKESASSYFYLPAKPSSPADRIIVCDLVGNHRDGRNVLFADGRVKLVKEDDFQRLLRQPENGEFVLALSKAEEGRRKEMYRPAP